MENKNTILLRPKRTPWNKGKLIGARPPLSDCSTLLRRTKFIAAA